MDSVAAPDPARARCGCSSSRNSSRSASSSARRPSISSSDARWDRLKASDYEIWAGLDASSWGLWHDSPYFGESSASGASTPSAESAESPMATGSQRSSPGSIYAALPGPELMEPALMEPELPEPELPEPALPDAAQSEPEGQLASEHSQSPEHKSTDIASGEFESNDGVLPGTGDSDPSLLPPEISEAEVEQWLGTLWSSIGHHYILSSLFQQQKNKIKRTILESDEPELEMEAFEESYKIALKAYYAPL